MVGVAPSLVSIVLLGAVSGMPLSVPPLPEDAALERAAPQQCLWYMSAAGTATPEASSSNQTEQLLAEPEIQQLLKEIETQIMRAVRREAHDREARVLATELPKLIKTALTHPLVAFVEDVQVHDRGPDVKAGFAIRLGDEAQSVEASILRLLALAGNEGPAGSARESEVGDWHAIPTPPDAPQLRWGVREGVLIVGVGSGQAERIAERLAGSGSPPAWLAKAKSGMQVPRRSTLGYVNVAGILERVRPHMGEDAQMLDRLGLSNVQAVYSATGLDDVACVSKAHIEIDGTPTGIFGLFPQAKLTAGDLAPAPSDATVAFALRLDAQETLDKVVDLVSQFEPDAREEFEEELWQMESELGIDIRQDVLGSLDDTVVMYMPGGSLFTAWTGSCAVVRIKDRRRIERTLDKLALVARMEMEPRGGRRSGAVMKESDFGDYTLHYVQFVGEPVPFTPSWCVTEEYLVAGLTPNAVKGTINNLGKESDSLANNEVVANALSQGPASLVYVDTQTLFRGLYPMAQFGLQAMASELAREGFDFDLALLPSVESIASHLVPTISSFRYEDNGFHFESRQSLPGGDFVSAAPMLIGLALPAVQTARFAARDMHDMNNMKQIALAFHNYTDVHNSFPTNVYDENGKALLSWRVRLLPYLEEGRLYEEFRLDEPWDSPHNRRLADRIPMPFVANNVPVGQGHTVFQAVVDERSLFPGNMKLSFRHVVDGTSMTIMFVQSAPHHAVPWTKPEDVKFDEQNPAAALMPARNGYLVAFCDGSVRRLSTAIDPQVLKNLVQRDDGNPIDYEALDGRRTSRGRARVDAPPVSDRTQRAAPSESIAP